MKIKAKKKSVYTLKKAEKMLEWHRKYHMPLSDSRMNEILTNLYIEGQKPISAQVDVIFELWNSALELLLEVERLNKEKA